MPKQEDIVDAEINAPSKELSEWLESKGYTLLVQPGFVHKGNGEFSVAFQAQCVVTPAKVVVKEETVAEEAKEA